MQEPLWEKRLNGGQKGLSPIVTAWYSGEPEFGSPASLPPIDLLLIFALLQFEGQKTFLYEVFSKNSVFMNG